ncbi:hypothetical protein [Cutibacterium sp. V947]|uniref:hypothetical protein n=1 Tax=unclassified Cutibacterium TaxID=2649671 RepID=UPI003EE079F8
MNIITPGEKEDLCNSIERLSGVNPAEFGDDWINTRFSEMDVDSLAVMGVASELLTARGAAEREVFPQDMPTPRALLDLVRNAPQQ